MHLARQAYDQDDKHTHNHYMLGLPASVASWYKGTNRTVQEVNPNNLNISPHLN